MAEPGTQEVSWAERMESLKNSAQQRVLNAPMPASAMDRLLADGEATVLGNFENSPVQYMGRWWRQTGSQWAALDETASAELDRHAERYRAAAAAAGAHGAVADAGEAPSRGAAPLPSSRPGAETK